MYLENILKIKPRYFKVLLNNMPTISLFGQLGSLKGCINCSSFSQVLINARLKLALVLCLSLMLSACQSVRIPGVKLINLKGHGKVAVIGGLTDIEVAYKKDQSKSESDVIQFRGGKSDHSEVQPQAARLEMSTSECQGEACEYLAQIDKEFSGNLVYLSKHGRLTLLKVPVKEDGPAADVNIPHESQLYAFCGELNNPCAVAEKKSTDSEKAADPNTLVSGKSHACGGVYLINSTLEAVWKNSDGRGTLNKIIAQCEKTYPGQLDPMPAGVVVSDEGGEIAEVVNNQ